MNTEQIVQRNKAVVERFLIGTHGGAFEVVDETVSPKIVTHGLPGGDPRSREEYKQFFATLEEAFPQMEFRIESMVAEGDQVAVRFAIDAVHRGPFLGIPATGRRVSFTGMVIYRLEQGLIAETWLYPDNLALLTQLGAMEAASQPREAVHA